MRLLEYHEIPGILIDLRSWKIQKFVASAKKLKTEHLGCNSQPGAGKSLFQVIHFFHEV